MPEGDTIYALAARLHEALAGAVVLKTTGDARAARAMNLVGRCVSRAESRGKHLLLFFDDGQVLRTHMRMQGRWRIVRGAHREHVLRRRHEVALHMEACVAVCLNAPDVELARSEARLSGLAGLGPDLLADDFEAHQERALHQLQSSGESLGVALMDQRNLAGIGNVYKSELLFMHRLSPFAAAADVDPEALQALLDDARKWLSRNARTKGPRRTRFGEGPALHVYRRAGEHCLVCGETVQMRRQGAQRRSTYFCPGCQHG